MIPLRDTIPTRSFPIVNTALIALNVLVFLFQAVLGPRQAEQLIWTAGLVPIRFWQVGGASGWLPVLSSMFMHGGWWHLISNMLALYIFGDNVEDRLGHARYLLFYLFGGLAASGAHLIAYSGSSLPTVGASGAIAGVLGAYLVLYPHARVVTLVPIFYFIRIVELPALIYLGFWFISQLFNGLFALTAADVFQGGGVAWWAHIGGFVFGLVTVRLIAPRRRLPPPPRTYIDDYRRW
ncbi:MAG: rhomboid family intramembrane serine protease [Chloroflexi bacterium]|nr:MAG: rhomboid family intramembrane serine protease [Anaerolineaceae bacterium 4572_32.2]RLC77597.1 MAG: rhomboid family intramembrane serine protease [Chloroflexota bacterium]RLC83466.1 MAG: rhomboid family intramembrane serine protease [Chloroflexota bacterium]HEY73098.1 rhomboid family intramembrane serine protease [Thermoflexia bacterium]